MSSSSSSDSDGSSEMETGSDSGSNSNNDSENEDFMQDRRSTHSNEKALQLISLERSSDLEETLCIKLHSNVLDSVLESCGERPLCVIAITGHSRSGKSFFMNCIKESLKAAEKEERESWLSKTKTISGFDWKHGYKSLTKGIWIWSRPFIVDTDEKEVAVLLLDTQGFNDEFTSAEEISAILGISLLTSSILLVNLTSDIPEEAFEWISPFSKYASLCVAKGLKDPFQKFSFLVRDWTRLREFQFEAEAGKKYLAKHSNSKAVKKLKSCWEEVTCFLLPNIGSNALLKTFTGNPADLNKEFSQRLKACVKSVTDEESLQHTKKIWGNEINAHEFKIFLENYVDFFNNKSEMELELKPESILRTTFEAAGKIKINRGLDAYKQLYQQRKRASFGGYLKNASIDSMHIQGRIKALEEFKQFSLPSEEEAQFKRKLEQILDQETENLKRENEGARNERVTQFIGRACDQLRDGLQIKFPFTPEVGSNLPENMVFYEAEILRETAEQLMEEGEAQFLEEFAGEDEEGKRSLRWTLNSVLQPIADKYMRKNSDNWTEAMNSAKVVRETLKGEYLAEMHEYLQQLPNMDSDVLGVLHSIVVKDIEQKLRAMSIGTPIYQTKWLEELKEEIEYEHELMELSLESTMAKALQMANEEAENYKVILGEKAQEFEEEEEMQNFHRETSAAILRKFTVDNPFPKDSTRGEMIYKKLENFLQTAFIQVVEEGVLTQRRMEETLQNAVETAFATYKASMERTLEEMEFLGEDQFELKSQSLRENAVALFENEIESIKLLDVEKLDNGKSTLITKLDANVRIWKNENEQRQTSAVAQADLILDEALEKYDAKMSRAASQLDSMDELLAEHTKWTDEIVKLFEKKCESKNAGLREGHLLKLSEGVHEIFATIEEFFNLSKEKHNIGLMTALLACKTEYVENMNREFSNNKNGFFNKTELAKLHKQSVKTALDNLAKDPPVSKNDRKELVKQLESCFQTYKERNDMVFRSFQTHEPAIGIDLGTTYCCVAIYVRGKVEIVRNNVSGEIIPSYVRINADGSKVFGTPAKEQAFESPETTIFDAKRIIGRRMDEPSLQKDMSYWPYSVVEEDGGPKIEVNGKRYYPEQVSSFLLEHLKAEAESTLGFPIKKAVITVPAYFTDGQRAATVHAGELAGLTVLAILNEPTAAAVAYRLDCCYDNKMRNILVYDLGGGTFDVAVLEMSREKINVLSVNGDGHLGGEDFDENMMTYCAGEFKLKTGFDLFTNKDSLVKTEKDEARRRLRRLKTACEDGKKALSTSPFKTISLDGFANSHDLVVEVTKTKFEEINAHLFQKTLVIVDEALRAANLERNDIDEIVLVGGSTKIPKLQKMLTAHFNGKALSKRINPDQAVAYGAAVQAAIKCAKPDEKLFDFDIQEVTGMSLGIEMATKEFDVIIPKGTKIPTTLKQEYATYRDNQPSAWIRIFQGENRTKAEANKLLGDFSLEGIPPNKAGKEVVEVTMHINANGIINVEAVCRSTNGKSNMTVCEKNKGIMTNEVKQKLIQEKRE